MLYEETTETRLCGDVISQLGYAATCSTGNLAGPATEAEDLFHFCSLHPSTAGVVRRLAELLRR